MPHLFDPLVLRGVTLPNRIGVSPMCEYSCENGFANDWHFVHLGSRAVGGAGLVFTEAAAVSPEGRIAPEDLGVWSEAHFEPLARIATFIAQQGAVPGMQLAHAGRKGSTFRPWSGDGVVTPAQGGWTPVGPDSRRFADNYPTPAPMTEADIARVREDFVTAARRAIAAGFRVLELHSAHGYLLHEFLSPLSNSRADRYGGPFENRTRFTCETVSAIRAAVPESCPLFVRISATDWVDGGWTVEESVVLARILKDLGADVVDCSSGGNVATAQIPVGPGYQLPFATRVRREAGIHTAAVGMITEAAQADQIVRNGDADIVLLARELLRDPYWPLHAAAKLGHTVSWPAQYLRAAPRGSTERKAI
jgi:2,4-dienoyl-CoA reductase-like NADH-dependent reductase (Old Yellow Enzyme family)